MVKSGPVLVHLSGTRICRPKRRSHEIRAIFPHLVLKRLDVQWKADRQANGPLRRNNV